MKRIFYTDLFVVLFLTIISLICLLIPAFNLNPLNLPVHYLAYILLLLFLPGYSLLAANDPLYGESSIIKRTICSIIVSMFISILLALILTYTPLKIFNSIMIYTLIAFTILLSLIAVLKRRRYHYVHFIEEDETPPTNGIKPREPEDLSKDIISTEELKTGKSDEKNIIKPLIKKDEQNKVKPEEKPVRNENIAKLIKHTQTLTEQRAAKNKEPERQIQPPAIEEPKILAETKNHVKPGIEPNKIDLKPGNEPKNKNDLKPENKTKKSIIPETKPPNKPVPKKIIETKNTKKKSKIKPLKTNQSPGNGKETTPGRFTYVDLILVLLLAVLSLLTVVWPFLNITLLDPVFKSSLLNMILAFLLMLFLPGYALTALIYPRRTGLDGVRRLILSFAISYFLTTIIGLVLYYMVGEMVNLQLIILAGCALTFTTAALLARWKVPAEYRYYVNFKSITGSKSSPGGSKQNPSPGGSNQNPSPGGSSRNRNILVLIIIIIAVFLIATPAYNMMKPAEVKYTEFYILGPDGNNFTQYPDNLTSGEGGNVTLVLVNHENTNTSYRIVFTSNQTVLGEMNITLKPDERKLIPYNFTAGEPGAVKYEFLLYKLPDLKDIYHAQNFWVNILELITQTEYNETYEETSLDESVEEPEYQEESEY